MVKKLMLGVLLLVSGIFLCTIPSVQAYSLSGFVYNGYDYGTMEITPLTGYPDALLIKFTVNNSLPGTPKVAGFAFNFDGLPASVGNPSIGDYSDDQDSINWYPLTNLNALPNPTNDNTVKKNDFNYAVTTNPSGANWSQSNPGLAEGQLDYFMLLNFPGSMITLGDYGDGYVNLVGVRVQSLPDSVNGGSLFLVPVKPISEPATMLLLGVGLIGLAAFGRKRFFRGA